MPSEFSGKLGKRFLFIYCLIPFLLTCGVCFAGEAGDSTELPECLAVNKLEQALRTTKARLEVKQNQYDHDDNLWLEAWYRDLSVATAGGTIGGLLGGAPVLAPALMVGGTVGGITASTAWVMNGRTSSVQKPQFTGLPDVDELLNGFEQNHMKLIDERIALENGQADCPRMKILFETSSYLDCRKSILKDELVLYQFESDWVEKNLPSYQGVCRKAKAHARNTAQQGNSQKIISDRVESKIDQSQSRGAESQSHHSAQTGK